MTWQWKWWRFWQHKPSRRDTIAGIMRGLSCDCGIGLRCMVIHDQWVALVTDAIYLSGVKIGED